MFVMREDLRAFLQLVKRSYVPLSALTPGVRAVLDNLEEIAAADDGQMLYVVNTADVSKASEPIAAPAGDISPDPDIPF